MISSALSKQSKQFARSVAGLATLTFCWAFLSTSPLPAEAPTAALWINGDLQAGALLNLDETEGTISIDGMSQQFSVSEMQAGTIRPVSISPAEDVSSNNQEHPSDSMVVEFTNGDVIQVESVQLKDDQFQLNMRSRGDLSARDPNSVASLIPVPIEYISYVRMGHLPRRRIEENVSTDRLLLGNGDAVPGEVDHIDRKAISLLTATGTTVVEWSRVKLVALNPELSAVPKRENLIADLILRNGSMLSVSKLQTDTDTCTATTELGFDMTLPWFEIERIDLYSPQVQPLSTLPIDESMGVSYLGRALAPTLNRNAAGDLLTLCRLPPTKMEASSLTRIPHLFSRGIGIRPRTSITWELQGEWTRFDTMAGIDQTAGNRASVEFCVVADGRELWRQTITSSSFPPDDNERSQNDRDRELMGMNVHHTGLLDVTGVQRLTLIADFAEFGDVDDLGNWCRPRLWRK